MKALITGASSGIGKDIAINLSQMGIDIIAVAKEKDKLDRLKENITTNLKILSIDLSIEENVYKLYEITKDENIDILVNNAGFGVFGNFTDTDLDKEINMLNVNIKAVHILTKLFLKDFKSKNKGYILNVASSAAFAPGPLMATYYASKAYVLRLTQSIAEELRKKHINVKISALCPGPVDTNFNNVAGVKFSVRPLKSEYVAKYAIKNMFKGKEIIVPGITMKLSRIASKIFPDKLTSKVTYNVQKKKKKDTK